MVIKFEIRVGIKEAINPNIKIKLNPFLSWYHNTFYRITQSNKLKKRGVLMICCILIQFYIFKVLESQYNATG
jgi:hypothetical protein